MIRKIHNRKALIAIQFTGFKNGTAPLTDPFEPLQIIALKRKAGNYTKAHIHKTNKRITQKLQECLIVIKGKIKVDLYSEQKKLFKTLFLSTGQAILFISGGHGVQIIKDSQIFEVKNGPFIEDKEMIE